MAGESNSGGGGLGGDGSRGQTGGSSQGRGGGGSGGSGGSPGGAAGAGGGGGASCVVTNGGVESCDAVDNDCDQSIDEDGCPATCSGATLATGSYMVCDSLVFWSDAEAACAEQGLTLVTIDDAAENAALTELMYPLDGSMDQLYFWIGLSRVDSSQALLWTDGTPLGVYSNWKNGPPGMAGTANCAQIDDVGEWLVSQCHRDKRFVCEL